MSERSDSLTSFGFSFERGGAHTARTMMAQDLETLLAYVGHRAAPRSEYLQAISEENCLGKRSGKTRILSCRHLVDLYSLDPSHLIFRALLFFWDRDTSGRTLLALLCTYARDSIFRSVVPFVLKAPVGSRIIRSELEAFIDSLEPGRFSPATLKSTAQNINSTLTQSGHLIGRSIKRRIQAEPTPGSVSYALLLGYLKGERGQLLFQTEYIKLLDCSFDRAIELAEEASRKGWIIFKHVGEVMEVAFPNIITRQERELLHEQN